MSLKTVVRAGNWWASKIPPLLAIAYAEILFHRTPLGLSLALLGAVAWSICSVASYGHVINDIFDIEQDRQAGKRNFMEPFTPWQQAGFALLTFAAGFLPLSWASYGLAAIVAMLVNFGLPTIYSIPPLRFKERGILGVLCDTSGAHLVPTIFIALVYTNNAPNPSENATWFLYLAAPWAFVFGLKGILNHQLADRASDLIAGAETFGTQSDPTRTLRFVSRVLYWIEVAALLGVVVTLWPVAPLVAASLPIYCGIEMLKGWVGWTFAFDQAGEVRGRNVPFANNRFYELWMPVALATELVFQQGSFIGVLLAHLWLFRANLFEQVREFSPLLAATRHALKNRKYESRWGLRLELLGLSDAELVAAEVDPGAKAVIHQTSGEPWDIKVFSRRYVITKGNGYRLRAKIRAEAPKKISFGICQGSQPWDGLGVNEKVELSAGWRTYFADFTASARESNARVYLWLGGDPKAVEIAELSLAPLARELSWTLDRTLGCDAVLLASEESTKGCRAEVLTTLGRSSDVKISVGRWPLHENRTYELRFVARADTPRYIGIAVAERDPPWSDVGISEPVEIASDWREYRFPLTARRSGDAAASFLLGERTGVVDVSDVAITTISPRPTWRLECQSPARAVRASLAGDETGIRVIPLEVNQMEGSIKLHARPLSLTKDGTYRVRLNARADETRDVLIEVAQDSAPWGGLGLSTTIAIGPRWEPWTRYFLATDEESLGTLQMGLGNSMVPVEVTKAEVELCLVGQFGFGCRRRFASPLASSRRLA
ncbi:MAG: carbohydrate binding domain-containing protein [Planctomycetota bacterium]